MRRSELFRKLRLGVCIGIIVSPFAVLAGSELAREGKANFLILLGDDCTWNELGCYGGQAKTPNIDRMAAEGLRFHQAVGTTAMCTPMRHSLYTGIYPIKRGGYKNHSAVKPGTKSIYHYLGALSYRVGLAGKKHINPKDTFPFEEVGGFPENCVMDKTPAHELDGVREFMTRKADEPFCLIIASVHPHLPWTEGDRSLYPPDSLKLPIHWADTEKTRTVYQKYLAEITELDRQVGDVMRLLREEKLENNTLFLFASEQGAEFPGAKWTLWDAGVKFAMIARWPGKIQANTSTQALVQYEDVLPTLIDLAGGQRIPLLDGRSFLPVLFGKADKHREYVYGLHTNTPEGPPYPIRSIRSRRYKLIINLLPDNTYKEKHLTEMDKGDFWKSWVAEAESDQHAAWAVNRYQHRPPVEFYDLQKDPWEINNLAGHPQYAEVISKMRAELDAWMKSQGDTGVATDK